MTQHNSPNPTPEDIKDLRTALFDALDKEHVGMLGIEGSADHMQPMTHFFDRETRTIWFISAHSTDLVQQLATPRTAHFTISGASNGVYACMSGALSRAEDREKLEELWSPAAAMWFKGGIDDPEVTLLRLPLAEAAVWRTDANVLQFGIEMARATLGDHDPDVGTHAVVPLAA